MSHSMDSVLVLSNTFKVKLDDDELDGSSFIEISFSLELRNSEGSRVGDGFGVGCNDGGAELDLMFA